MCRQAAPRNVDAMRNAGLIWLLLLVPLVVSLGTQQLLRSVYRRYRAVRNHAGLTGAEAARALLDAHGLQRVRIRPVAGTLTDNYDGDNKTLSLSRPVGGEASVSALGISAHEVAHAYQDAEGNRAYRARRSIGEPLAALAPLFSFCLIGGYWFRVPELVVLALVYAAGLVLFAFATLPVEFGASHRAIGVLHETGLTDAEEETGVRRVLSAAALTYVVGLLDRLGYFLALLIIAEVMRRYVAGGG
jgi:Zn-dependent membrane protease YugP